jgi:hypothetical protein
MRIIFCFCSLALVALTSTISAQYGSNSQLMARIKALDQKDGMVTSSVITKTKGKKDIMVVTVGKGDPGLKPGIAVIGGVRGSSLASVEIIMQVLEKLILKDPSILNEITFYFFPDMTPDASEQYFAPLEYEREENVRPYDDDRDGLTDEDGYDDLNQDGLISLMRIKDPDKGEYRIHPDNPAVLTKADITKNQKGEYRIMLEGIDNDQDGKINEDLPGGVIFNKNFSYHYPYFEHGAGENAFSEEESFALARFLFDHWNIYTVISIGPENNLSEYSELKSNQIDPKVPTAVHEKDKPYFESMVTVYKSLVKLSDSTTVGPSGGDLLSWAYFHYNRFAFSTPAWNVARNKNNLGSPEFDYLKWASENGLQDQTIPWQKIDHPDFPEREVEIGGLKPLRIYNPPLTVLDTVSDQHLDFLLAVAAMHPALTFSDIKVTKRSSDIYLIEAELTNNGKCPTMTALARDSKWVKKIRLDILPSKTQQVNGGRKVFLFDRIIPGESVKASWLITGKGKIFLKAGSPQTGFVNREIDLN